MPQRPTQHVIGEKAESCFKAAFPGDWTISSLIPDYAKDFLVEVVARGELLGKQFIVQLKGTTSLKRQGNFVIAPVKQEHIDYWCRRLQLPVMIALADVATGNVYYDFVQVTAGKHPHRRPKTVTAVVRYKIPISHRVDRVEDFLGKLEEAYAQVRRQFPGTPSAAIQNRIKELQSIDPRFEYSVAATEKGESIVLSAKDPVTFLTRFKGEPDTVSLRVRDFFERGEPLVADDKFEIIVEGMPLLEVCGNKLEKIEIPPVGSFELLIGGIDSATGRRGFASVHLPVKRRYSRTFDKVRDARPTYLWSYQAKV